ncbi:MAG: methyltransferase domain-containing protein [Gammaproteobacteria bacterium]
MRAWYRKAPGTLLIASEREEVERLLPYIFGYHILQIGSLGRERSLLNSCRIKHRLVIDSDFQNGSSDAGLYSQAGALPIASDSVDAVVLAHTLELELDPHQVLREAERVLIPEGHLLVIGFNPWSIWGLWRLFLRRSREVPWCTRFVSPARVKDWLALLGFDIAHEAGLFYRPPLPYEGLMNRLMFLEKLGRRFWPLLGGGYVILARKRVTTVTPIRLPWKRRARVVPGLVEPTTRSYQNGGQQRGQG